MRISTLVLAFAVLPGTVGPLAAVGEEEARPAARIRVSVTEFQFTPRNVQVRVGDTVVWTNNGTMTHTSTANGGLWNSGNLAPEKSFAFTFNATGQFPYRCTIHPVQMRGGVRVIP